jgi:signal peptidase I
LSDPFDSKFNSDSSPEIEPAEADPAESSSSAETPEKNQSPTPPPTELPLPDVASDSEEDLPPSSAKVTSAHPARLSELVTTGEVDQVPESGQDSSRGVYKISSAEPDWSGYTLSPLEDESPMEPQDTDAGWKTAWAVVREVGETIILTLIIFLLIQTVIRNFRVVGTSMIDNLHDGQYLIIDKLSYNPLITDVLRMGGPQRGDVVVFEPPNRPAEDYVKRVIALPGETVEIKRGQILINGQPLEEPFHPNTGTYSMPPRVVPEGQVFVLGDNRNNSNDSHNWGPLPVENIVGRAWLSYWPPDRWGTISRDAPTEQTTLKYFLQDLVPSANAESE